MSTQSLVRFSLVLCMAHSLTAVARAGVESPPPPPAPPNGPSPNCTSPVPPYFGDNPSLADIKAKLIAAGQKYSVPPHILFGIAFQESGWNQFRPDRRTVYHLEPDCRVGVGIMQITVDPSVSDYQKLCTDIDYNIDRGASMLAGEKWNATPFIGDNDRAKLENWFYAVWAYNGFVCPNPNDYANKVWANIANNPIGMWQAVTLTKAPQTCPVGRAAQPTPYHVDANYDGIIDGTTPPCNPDYNNLFLQFGVGGTHCGTNDNPLADFGTALSQVANGGSIVFKNGGGIGGGTISPGKTVTLKPSGGPVTLTP